MSFIRKTINTNSKENKIMVRKRVKNTAFPCGHKGQGVFCHRCHQADQIEQMAQNKEKVQTYKKTNPNTGKKHTRTWTYKQMKQEAERLRSIPPKKKGKSQTQQQSIVNEIEEKEENSETEEQNPLDEIIVR